jgi:D-alanine transaminase
MTRIAYVNGAYLPMSAAGVSIEDRGFQFADAIYEVVGLRDGVLLDRNGHLTRLTRSLAALQIASPMARGALLVILNEIIRRNRLRNGYVYIQISRGAAPRDHLFPSPAIAPPTIIVSATRLDRESLNRRGREGVRVVSMPDERWARCDIKSVNLLANVFAKEAAREAGAQEAWFVDEAGRVREGAASNAWIVDAEGRLRTAPLSPHILAGVTRETLIALARERQISVAEEAFTPEEALLAQEAFISSASNGPVPVIALNGKAIGAGAPGPVTLALRGAYFGAYGLRS